MSTGLIVAIVVAVLILVVLFAVVLPRSRRNAEVKARERELEHRRGERVEQHRVEAAERRNEAEMAEQRARVAESEAELSERRAQMHERGMADDELIDESERDRFAGTSAEERPMHEPEDGRFARERERTDDPTRSGPA